MLELEKVDTIPTWEHEKEMDRGDKLHHSVTQELQSLVMRHLIIKNNITTAVIRKLYVLNNPILYKYTTNCLHKKITEVKGYGTAANILNTNIKERKKLKKWMV
jgi:hypothetical protein